MATLLDLQKKLKQIVGLTRKSYEAVYGGKPKVQPLESLRQGKPREALRTLSERGAFGPIPPLAKWVTQKYPKTTMPISHFVAGTSPFPVSRIALGEPLPEPEKYRGYRAAGGALTTGIIGGPAAIPRIAGIGAGLGTGAQALQNILAGKPITTDIKEAAWKSAQYGLEKGSTYIMTASIVDKLANTFKILEPITRAGIKRTMPVGTQTIGEWMKNLGKTGLKRMIRATIIETPLEGLTWGAKEQKKGQRLIDSIAQQTVENFVYNIGYAGMNTIVDGRTIAPIMKRSLDEAFTQYKLLPAEVRQRGAVDWFAKIGLEKLSPTELKKRFKQPNVERALREEFMAWVRDQFGREFDPEIADKSFRKAWRLSTSPEDFAKRISTQKQFTGATSFKKWVLANYEDWGHWYRDVVPPHPAEPIKVAEEPKVKVTPWEKEPLAVSPKEVKKIQEGWKVPLVEEAPVKPPEWVERGRMLRGEPPAIRAEPEPKVRVEPPVEEIKPVRKVLKGFKEAIKGKEMTFEEKDVEQAEAIRTLTARLEKYMDLDIQKLYRYMWNEIDAPSARYKEAAKELEKMWKMFEMAEPELATGIVLPRQRYTPNYTRSQMIGKLLEEYPHSMLTEKVFEFPHLKHKTKPYAFFEDVTLRDVVEFRIKTGVANIYDKAKIIEATPLEEVRAEVAEHIEKMESGKPMDYVGKLGELIPEKKIVSDYSIKRITTPIEGQPLRTENDIFSKIGGDLFDSFREMRDAADHAEIRRAEVDKLVKADRIGQVITYFADIIGLEGVERSEFILNSQQGIRQYGVDSYVDYVFKGIDRRIPLQKFIDTAAKYEFTEPSTKEFVNEFIDYELKGVKAEKALFDEVLDGINAVFSLAHIGWNIKVAAVQGTEVARMPAVYGWRNTAEGVKRSVPFSPEYKRLKDTYGFAKKRTHYEIELGKRVGTVPKAVYRKVRGFLFAPLQAVEGWKNVVYTGAAEAEGKAQGKTGVELYNHVRDSVFKHAHIADKYNTPTFMKRSAIYRAGLQYMQFAIKNAFGKIDAAQEKEYVRLGGLLIADIFNALLISTAVGYPLRWAFKGLFPVGFGPIATVPGRIYKEASTYLRHKERGWSTAGAEEHLKRILRGSLMPTGSQYNKSAEALSIIRKDYAETPGGDIKHLGPTSALEAGWGLLFGPGAMRGRRQYYKELKEGGMEGRPLTTNRSEMIRRAERGDRVTLYEDIRRERVDTREKKQILKEVEETHVTIVGKDDIFYWDGEDASYLNFGKYLEKGPTEGIAKYEFKEEKIKMAIKIHEMDDVSEVERKGIISRLGYDWDEITYEADAREDSFVKAEYVASMVADMEPDELWTALLSGRVQSLTGKLLINNATIDRLVDKGIITYEEGKLLKKYEFGKDGALLPSSGIARGVGKKKPKKITIKKAKIKPVKVTGLKKGKIPTIKMESPPKLKVYQTKPVRIETSVKGIPVIKLKPVSYSIKIVKG